MSTSYTKRNKTGTNYASNKTKKQSTLSLINGILSSTPEYANYFAFKQYKGLNPDTTKVLDIKDINDIYTQLKKNPMLNALFEAHRLGIFAKKSDAHLYVYTVVQGTLNKLSGYDLDKQYEHRELTKLRVKYVIAELVMPDTVKDVMVTCEESKSLSEGSFGAVKTCKTLSISKRNKRLPLKYTTFAVKYMKRSADVDDAQREIDMMQKLQGHPNFVHVYPHIKLTNPEMPHYIVQEYCNQGNLFDYGSLFLAGQTNPDPIRNMFSNMLINVFSDIYSAIKYLHSKGLIHSDIKPKNIFVAASVAKGSYGPEHVVFKLGDLGGIHSSTEDLRVRTAAYSPYERYMRNRYFIDYYGFALSLFTLITLEHPPAKQYSDATLVTLHDIFEKVLSKHTNYINFLNDKAKALIKSLFTLLGNIERAMLEDPMDEERFDMPEYVAFFKQFEHLNNYKYTAKQVRNNNLSVLNTNKRNSLKRKGINIDTPTNSSDV